MEKFVAKVWRRGALIAALALSTAVLAACGSSDADTKSTSDGLTKVKVMMFPGQALRFPSVVAKEKGYFKDAGLDVEFVDQPATLGVVQALQATGANFAQPTDASLLESYQAGAEMKIACGQQTQQLMSILAPKDSSLETMDEAGSWEATLKQLKGKKIGFPTPVGTGFQKLFATMLKQAGVDDVTYVLLGLAPAQIDPAVKRGSVDVAVTFPTATQFLQNNGTAKELIFLPDGPPLYSDLHFATWAGLPKWIEDNPETAKSYCAAVTEASDYMHDKSNYAELSALLSKDTGVDAATATKVFEDGVFDTYSTELTKETWDTTLKGLVEAGVVKDSPLPEYEDIVLQGAN